jgi:O-antigen/teichoic acid export membrane protein
VTPGDPAGIEAPSASAPPPAGMPSPAPPTGAASLTERASAGMAWGAGAALAFQAVAVVVQVLLTYLLSKPQYGIYGIAAAVLTLTGLLQQVGLSEVLQHRRTAIHLWVNPAVWLSALLGACGALVLAAAAMPMARLYGSGTLGWLLLLMTPVPLVRSLGVVPQGLLVNAMRFRVYYGLMLGAGVTNSLLVLAFAGAGLGVYSFAAAMLVAEPLYTLALWRATRPRVRRGPQLTRWRYLLGDLGLVFGSNAARWARSASDALVLGIIAGPAATGTYVFAMSMAVQVVRVVTLNLASALLPALTRLQADPQRGVAAFLRAARALMFIGAPMCVGLAASSRLFVNAFLDAEKWHDLPPVLSLLALGVTFRLLEEPMQSLLVAQGRFRTAFRVSLAAVLLFVVAVSLGALRGGALGAAAAVALFHLVTGPTQLLVACRPGGLRPLAALRVYLEPVLLSALAIGPWYLLVRSLPVTSRAGNALELAGLIVASGLTYAALATVLRSAAWRELLERAEGLAPARLRPPLAALRWLAARGRPGAGYTPPPSRPR